MKAAPLGLMWICSPYFVSLCDPTLQTVKMGFLLTVWCVPGIHHSRNTYPDLRTLTGEPTTTPSSTYGFVLAKKMFLANTSTRNAFKNTPVRSGCRCLGPGLIRPVIASLTSWLWRTFSKGPICRMSDIGDSQFCKPCSLSALYIQLQCCNINAI